MCSRQELRYLLYELLFRLDQVAYLGARTQFNEECNSISNAQRYGGCIDQTAPYANGTEHFAKILRFQKAYIRYFVFVSDPYTEFIVPMKSSSLVLFINNILSRDGPVQSPMAGHTSRTIIEFLQVNSCGFSFVCWVDTLFLRILAKARCVCTLCCVWLCVCVSPPYLQSALNFLIIYR